jgi:hypothetical protein
MGPSQAPGSVWLPGCVWRLAEGLRFVDETVDAGYATYRTLATVRVPVESLFPVQVGRGPVPISETPHFSFVKAHVGHQGADWNKNDWMSYMAHESASPAAAIAKRQARFEKLIDEIGQTPADVHLLVAVNPRVRGFEIVDGFHRAAIVAVCRPGTRVSCSVVSHIVA